MAKHTIDPTMYDYDEIFAIEEEREARLQALEDRHIVHYRTKRSRAATSWNVKYIPYGTRRDRQNGHANKTAPARRKNALTTKTPSRTLCGL